MATLTLAFKGKTLHDYPLKDGLFTIGRDPGCDIQIDSLAVEPQHARLIVQDKIITLADGRHDNSTYLNHKPISEQVLKNNDVIRIGKHVLIYSDRVMATERKSVPTSIHTSTNVQSPTTINAATSEQAKSKVENSGWLQVMSGKKLGRTFKLRAGLTDLGKLGMLPALIALRSSGYFISNLADDNNLSVEDKTIGEKSHPLHDGDVIKSGKVTLQFHLQV